MVPANAASVSDERRAAFGLVTDHRVTLGRAESPLSSSVPRSHRLVILRACVSERRWLNLETISDDRRIDQDDAFFDLDHC